MPTVTGAGALLGGAFVAAFVIAALLLARWRGWGRAESRQDLAVARAELAAVHEEIAEARVRAVELRTEAEAEAERIVAKARVTAETEATDVRRESEARAASIRAAAGDFRAEVDRQVRARRSELDREAEHLQRREHLLSERDTVLAAQASDLDARARQLDERARDLQAQDTDLAERRSELVDLEADRRRILEQVAGLSAEDARTELIASIEEDAKRRASSTTREIERRARLDADERAREVIGTAIQRLAATQTSESAVTIVRLPEDDMKGRIIGRDGRNIKAFEHVTGVNLVIDDTPSVVQLSCFDPVRREVARATLELLVADGRIHPQRIEEAYEHCVADIERVCLRAGEEAAQDVGIGDLDDELVRLLGTLSFRTSYGQNVLGHLVESAHLAGLMAAELGLDRRSIALAKRCALLHDIGKALTHEAEGSHAAIGAELARRCGESEAVVHAIEAHHNEVEPRTLEAVLTQAADAISGSRPGARHESLQAYVRRLERLEEIARSWPGVEKVYAMQAGRELRVMVLPEVVDDLQAQVLARDIAHRIEDELTYPGQIRITVVRESRAVGIAA